MSRPNKTRLRLKSLVHHLTAERQEDRERRGLRAPISYYRFLVEELTPHPKYCKVAGKTNKLLFEFDGIILLFAMAASALGTKDDPVSVSVPPVLAMEAPQLWERPVLSLFKHLGIEDSWKKARKVGDVKKTIDKRIGKRTFCIRGAISAANFIEIPKYVW